MALSSGLALISLAVATGNGSLITEFTPDHVTAALEAVGIGYEVGTAEDGTPLVSVKATVLPVVQMEVFFYDCADTACESIMVWSWFDMDPEGDLAVVNAFNRDFRWSKAYMDSEGDVVLEMDISANGGLGPDNLHYLLERYFEGMSALADLL